MLFSSVRLASPYQIKPSPSGMEIRPMSQLHIDIDSTEKEWFPFERRIHKVSPHLRMKDTLPSVYDPIMVSLGPYHHGKEEFKRAEEFKYICLHWCTNGVEEAKDTFYHMIFNKIDEIRRCYAEVSTVNKYDDQALALMILLDACFIISFMEIRVSGRVASNWINCLGMAAAVPITARDIMVLENQIPLFAIELLISKMYSEGVEKKFLREFISAMMNVGLEHTNIPREDENASIHFLEACWRVLVEEESTKNRPNATLRRIQSQKCSLSFRLPRNQEEQNEMARDSYYGPWIRSAGSVPDPPEKNRCYVSEMTSYHAACPPATYLKSKGIRLCPSTSHSLKDIKFASYSSYSQLQLPVCYLSDLTRVSLSNMIAYEIAPDNGLCSPELTVLSYCNFMKSLIQTDADVRELQEKGILLLNRFTNLEEVVHLFHSIDTFNLRDTKIYDDVLHGIGDHCNSRPRRWIAELVHSRLKSPWTIIALLSATFLLILSFLQTFYTINPTN